MITKKRMNQKGAVSHTMMNIFDALNKAFARWFRRKATIKSILAQASDADKQELIADYELVQRLSNQLSHPEMRQVFSQLNPPLTLQLTIMVNWSDYVAQVVSLIEKASHDEKQEIANNTAILNHIMITYRDDYKEQIRRHLNLLAAQTFTNYPNNHSVGFTSLMVLCQDKLTISKEVNFVPSGTFVHNKVGFETLKSRFIVAVTSYLSNKYKLKIESAYEEQNAQASGEYPIIVKLGHNPDADYHLILIGGGSGRGGLSKRRGRIYELGQIDETLVPSVYLAHEAAHLILGVDDEYEPEWFSERVVHKDHSLMGNFYVEGRKEAEIKMRHFQFLVPLVLRWFPDHTISIVE